MKIWVIGRNYPTPRNKMCGSFEYEQAQILAKKGHDVCYIACPFHPLYKVKKWGAVDWQEGDIHIYAYSQLYFPQRLNIYWDSFKKPIWERLLCRIEEEQGLPDVIHLHYPTMISVPEPILAFKEKGTKIVATEHWSNVLRRSITGHAKDQLIKYVQNVDHFICVGKPLKESVLALTGTNREIEIVPNVVPDTFSAIEGNHYDEGNDIKFITVGRLVKEKQVDKIISAFAKVYQTDRNVSLTVVGSGNQLGNLKRLAFEKGVREHVVFTGALSRTNVADLMCKSDALISYSRFETFGVPIIEGWFSGIPAIASTGIGFSEYWKDFLGEIVPLEKENALKNAIETVKNRIGGGYYSKRKIREYAKTHFSEDAVYQMLIKLYQK